MRILVLEAYYEPDGGPAAPLFTMLSQELTRKGHEVTVLTAVPHYPSGIVPQEYRGFKIRRNSEKGVDIIRVPLPSADRSKLIQRFFQFSIYQLISVIAGWNIKFDVLISATPSLEIWLPYIYFTSIRGKPSIYSVHDVYPDSGIRLGIFRNKLIISIVTFLEKSCLQRAKIVRILSKSFKPGILRLGVSDSRIRLIYDWVDTNLIYPTSKANSFALEQGLDDKFVVLYAGNIGFSQSLENILEAAKIIDDKDIHFVFIGDGAAKESLIKLSQSKNIQNISFLPFQPRSRLPEVLGTADISLVILRKGMGFNSLPSKTLSILASGRPMIASIDPGSDTWNLVEHSQSGICIPPEDPKRLSEAIMKLKSDKILRQDMGKKGREYALTHHSLGAAAEAFEKILIEAILSNP